MKRIIFVLVMAASLVACEDTPTYAPVYDVGNIEPLIRQATRAQQQAQEEMEPQPVASEASNYGFASPVSSDLKHKFNLVRKGVDISGVPGEPIFAIAKGKVVYAGEGLKGYGKLIIIKHKHTYVSVYAHNETLLVREGDFVKKGQILAKMGNTGTNTVKLHFEVRKSGKPINPLRFMPIKTV